jgi:hypothetical protein
MIAVAAAAIAAAGSQRSAHAAAWTRVFTAYASARRGALLGGASAPPGATGTAEALLHLAALPQLHRGSPVALPALEAWAEVLDEDDRGAAGGGSGAEGGREGGGRWGWGPLQLRAGRLAVAGGVASGLASPATS